MPTRILIIDDHPLFRNGLRTLLRDQKDLQLIAEADTAADAVRLARELQPDLVLMDLSLPDGNGLETLRQIAAQQPQIRIIVLTMHDDPALLVAAAKAGARGYILKGVRSADLLRAIHAVIANGAALSPEMLPDLLREYRRLAQTATPTPQLTAREREILALAATGAGNREIADRLALSLQTIKNALSIIYQKLGVKNRTEAVVMALERGWLEAGPEQDHGT